MILEYYCHGWEHDLEKNPPVNFGFYDISCVVYSVILADIRDLNFNNHYIFPLLGSWWFRQQLQGFVSVIHRVQSGSGHSAKDEEWVHCGRFHEHMDYQTGFIV